MSALPVSGTQYFKDFAFDVVEYSIERDGDIVSTVHGLPNKEHGQPYIHVQLDCDVRPGDVLIASGSRVVVRSIDTDTYAGTPSLLKLLL